MASLEILKSSLSLFSVSQPNSRRRSNYFWSEFNSEVTAKRILRIRSHRSSEFWTNKRFTVCCKVQDGERQSNGEEPPESLFMKELKKRGMNPSSLLEESNRSISADEIKVKEEGGGFSSRNAVSTDFERNLSNQRELSMALNSEGLEGLIPRAKLLLTLGGTFFLGFWPLILITVSFFSALYLYFGPSFIHDGSEKPVASPQYVDPYALLEDEKISQTAPHLN
ncbi:unnamed protein product [Ilex paraguariensis]|uniref:Tubulin alpha-6 chain n=1 Tax=Ilex paraguariensis TaxID=185542 RepID=A0ABC8RK81_9AQUA